MNRFKNLLSLIVQQTLFWVGVFLLYFKWAEADAAPTVTSTVCCIIQGFLLFGIMCGLSLLLDWITEMANKGGAR